jgi:hypothetical protein
MVDKRQRRSLKSQQQFQPMKCGSMAFQILSALLALRGLYAILASDEISYLDYSPSNIQSSQGNNNNNNNKNNHLRQLKKVFHPIHVYRGSETAIQNLDTKTTGMRQYNPNSQVDQDKIVSALTKQLDAKSSIFHKKLFFVDLAANDAIQLSNTLRLEEEGWHGLCIGTYE